ncbi:MAG: metallophosphoesterase [Deltaproteobacteria bacterium]|nr:metallophosphoesterase [Deltaproteobacteria bacterium]
MAEPGVRPLWLVSDVHLTPDRPARTEQFLAFLESRVAPSGADLIIAGDLFDWWFGSSPAPPDVRRVVRALEGLPGSVLWMEGNHDVFVGRGLHEASPVGTTAEPVELERFGRRLHVAHGDLVDPSERGYRIFRALLRGVPGRLAAAVVGPGLTREIGALAATGSRQAQGGVDGYDGLSQPWLKAAKSYAASSGAQITILGHGHWFGWWPGLVCLGDWLRWSSYARLDAGGLSLWRYATDEDERVASAPVGAIELTEGRRTHLS